MKRFWEKVDRRSADECWLWRACLFTSSGGYGRFVLRGRNVLAHRVAWELERGAAPSGLGVLHTCEGRYPDGDITYRKCVNPAHLKLGTPKDNADDRVRTGRARKNQPRGDRHWSRVQPERMARGDRHGHRTRPESVPRGERSGNAKLTATDVVAIRAAYAKGQVRQSDLASQYGVAQTLISRVIRRESWKHI